MKGYKVFRDVEGVLTVQRLEPPFFTMQFEGNNGKVLDDEHLNEFLSMGKCTASDVARFMAEAGDAAVEYLKKENH